MTPLDRPRLLARSARRRWIGRSLDIREQAASTNDLAHAAAESASPPESGHVIIAEHQSAGRGQRGRVWSAPPGSALLFSVLLEPPSELSAPAFLTGWAAIAAAWTLRSLGLPAVIKWPNDLLVEDRKIAGILVERRQATVVGMGLNVSIQPHEFPSDVRIPATSVEIELGRPIDRSDLFNQILDQLDHIFAEALERGLEPIWRQWTELSQDLVGRPVRVTLSAGELTGELIDLRPDRGARLLLPSGLTHPIPPEQIIRVDRHPKQTTS
jgi:BirA family biotin operon repressor/biotin-[acetyl-CoA-carboxylase] ligase